ncbi:acyl dehydratase [Bradyrhizobium sp. LB7.1]
MLAGDTVAYANVVIDKRSSASRPGWGILTARTTGTNQRGEEVYAITASAFVPMRVQGG